MITRTLIASALAASLFVAALSFETPAIAGSYERVPAARIDLPSDVEIETAIFAGGCFWGVEAVFERVRGVKSAVSGYAGGHVENPTYRQVTTGTTGHAESVRVTFDPDVVSYADLLQVYFSVIADPTLKNRQGPDVGPHYRTAFFPIDQRQARIARAYIAQLDEAGIYSRPIVTTLEKPGKFFKAEEYHQNYMRKNPNSAYILAHDAPKVRAFERLFPDLVKRS